MAYNFLATTHTAPDWKTLHAKIYKPDTALELFPIESDEAGTYSLGICLPFQKMEEYPETWDVLVETLQVLWEEFDFEVYDLYNGMYVTNDDLDELREILEL